MIQKLQFWSFSNSQILIAYRKINSKLKNCNISAINIIYKKPEIMSD